MIKLKNSVFKLVKNAKNNINHIDSEDAIKIHSNKMNMFIDIRDTREIKKSGRILGAKHVPRGMLEFWIDPDSPNHKKFFNEIFNFIFYCATDWLSAIATLAANNICLLNTSDLIGGYNRWLELSGPIEESR